MTIFGRNYKTKFTPLLLGLAALTILVGVFILSTTYSVEVLAQTQQDTPSGTDFVICGDTVDNPCKIDHLFLVVVMIINYLIAMAGLVALLFILIAGVQMTMSRGEALLIEAKKRLSGAIIGLVLVALAFVLVNSLFTGSFKLGVTDGSLILTNPKEYIKKQNTQSTDTTPTPGQTPPIIKTKGK